MKVGDLVQWNRENLELLGIYIGTLSGHDYSTIARVVNAEGRIVWVAISKLKVVQ
jgi:hypothetical protein